MNKRPSGQVSGSHQNKSLTYLLNVNSLEFIVIVESRNKLNYISKKSTTLKQVFMYLVSKISDIIKLCPVYAYAYSINII